MGQAVNHQSIQQTLAGSTKAICSTYRQIIDLLETLPANQVLDQFKQYAKSTLSYAEAHYTLPDKVDLVICKQRHDPARMLSEVNSRFKAQEQGIYTLYPDPDFGQKIKALFEKTADDFAILENSLAQVQDS
jgi:hypothetical protein